MKSDLVAITDKILKRILLQKFSGFDPYDSLNSSFFSVVPSLKKGLFGLAWIQLNKCSIVNIRPFLGVPAMRNPKGIGLFILGLLEDYERTQERAYLAQATELADWLLTQKSDMEQWHHACWGYHFDWKARAFFVPKGKPNVITTIYVAQALYALGKVTNKQRYITPALDAAHFIVKTLYCEYDGRQFFAYIPGEDAFIHNASLWGAAWVGFVANKTGNAAYKKLAIKVARQSVSEQGEDGSWVYGARNHHQFIDGFHTGYNLEALHMLRESLTISEFDEAIKKGLAYYSVHLFDDNGTAKYYNNNKYPLDMHCVSQAIFTLLKVGGTSEDVAMAQKIIDKSIETLYMPKQQRFVYQKHKYFTNRIDYIRWTQAWVYYSFAYFNNYVQQIPTVPMLQSNLLDREGENATD